MGTGLRAAASGCLPRQAEAALQPFYAGSIDRALAGPFAGSGAAELAAFRRSGLVVEPGAAGTSYLDGLVGASAGDECVVGAAPAPDCRQHRGTVHRARRRTARRAGPASEPRRQPRARRSRAHRRERSPRRGGRRGRDVAGADRR